MFIRDIFVEKLFSPSPSIFIRQSEIEEHGGLKRKVSVAQMSSLLPLQATQNHSALCNAVVKL